MPDKYSTCGSCGSRGAEGKGIFYCPNKFCMASGAFNLRVKAGYHNENGKVSEDQAEQWLADGRKALAEAEHHAAVLRRSMERLEKSYALDV